MTLAELLFGIAALPIGKRKDLLSEALSRLMLLFRGRVLAFDIACTRAYADVLAAARKAGSGIEAADAAIAAIAPTK